MMNWWQKRLRTLTADDGALSVWLIVMVPVIGIVLGLIMEGGAAIAARQDVIGISRETSRMAVNQLNEDAYMGGREQVTGQAVRQALSWGNGQGVLCTSPGAVNGGDGVSVTVTCTRTFRGPILSFLGQPVQLISSTSTAESRIIAG